MTAGSIYENLLFPDFICCEAGQNETDFKVSALVDSRFNLDHEEKR